MFFEVDQLIENIDLRNLGYVLARGHNEALFTLTKPESQNFQSTTIFK